MKRILFISAGRVQPGEGSGERSLSIHHGLSRIAEVDVLVVPNRGVPHDARRGEHVARLPEPRDAHDKWYWRRRTYLLSDFRPDRGLQSAVARLHSERGYGAFVGRYQLPVLGGCPRFGPSFIDLDDVPVDGVRPRLPGMHAVRRSAMNLSLRKFQGVFVAKQADVSKIRHPRIAVLPCISTQPPPDRVPDDGAEALRMLFVGSSYAPNHEALNRFVERSLPLIRKRLPAAVLRVVGSVGESAVRSPGVEVAGFVPELTDEYRRASLAICPVRRGGGAVIKLAEAAGFGQAIVATPYSAAGYEGVLVPGRDLLVAESDEEFADRCVELLTDPVRRAALRESAHRTAQAGLSQAAIDRVIERTVGSVL